MSEQSLNDRVQDLVNGLAGHVGLLDWLMTLAANNLILLGPVLLLVLWFWPASAPVRALNQRLVVAGALGAMMALVLGAGLGRLYSESRPFVTDPSTRLLIGHAADNGMPSDHALAAFALAGALLWWRRVLGWVAIAGATLIGVARVYVGVHWPSEVLVGALVGLTTGMLAARTVPWWIGAQQRCSRFLPAVVLARPQPDTPTPHPRHESFP